MTVSRNRVAIRSGGCWGVGNACESTLDGVLMFWMSEGAPPGPTKPEGSVREVGGDSVGSTHARVAE